VKGKQALSASFVPTLMTIAIPIALQNLVSSSVNMLDTVMVGQLGAASLAAVGLGNQIYFLLMLLLYGISTGSGIFIAQYWGKRDLPGIHRTLGLGLCVGLVAGTLFMIAAIVAPRTLIGLYSRDAEVIRLGADYLRVAALSYLPTVASFILGFAMRSCERVKLPLVASVVSLSMNAFLNWVLIFGKFGLPALGVIGAAWATVAARGIEVAIMIVVPYLRNYPTAGRLRELVDWSGIWISRFAAIALPVVINEVIWSLGITTYNAIFARSGTEAIAAYNVTGTVSQLAMVVFFGTANAAAVMIGNKIGENRLDVARDWARRFVLLAPALGLAFGLLLIPFRSLLPFIFKVDASVLAQSSAMLLILGLTFPFRVFNFHLVVGICRAGGDTKFGLFFDLLGVWGIGVPLAALGAFVWGFPAWGIYLMCSVEEVAKSFLGLWRFLSHKWLKDLTAGEVAQKPLP
jgi:putative MATE family efflux protein